MNEAVVMLDHVTRHYGKSIVAIDDLSFKLQEGACFGLIGRNGAGKTTLLRLIMGMLHPTRGTLSVFGEDPWENPERLKAQIGYLAEDQQLPEILTPSDLFKLFSRFYPTWDHEFQKSLIQRLDLPLNRRLSSLSKGQKRQAALICAVAHRPKLLVLDEPAGGLDPVVRKEFLDTVIELLNQEGTTVLFSSHHLQELERVASHIGILHQGKLLLEEGLDTLKEGSCRVLVDSQLIEKINSHTLPGYIHHTERGPHCSVTLMSSEEVARQRIREAYDLEVIQSQPLSLEDVFIDLVGGQKNTVQVSS